MKVLYGGAFDLIHLGHIRAIKQARSYGDWLVINVNSDFQIQAKKGFDRPVIPGEERVEILKALKDVDEVVYLPQARGIVIGEILDLVRPDILVINPEESVFNQKAKIECEKRGIKIIGQERIIVKSTLDTTRIIKKIKEGGDAQVSWSELHISTPRQSGAAPVAG